MQVAQHVFQQVLGHQRLGAQAPLAFAADHPLRQKTGAHGPLHAQRFTQARGQYQGGLDHKIGVGIRVQGHTGFGQNAVVEHQRLAHHARMPLGAFQAVDGFAGHCLFQHGPLLAELVPEAQGFFAGTKGLELCVQLFDVLHDLVAHGGSALCQ